MDVKENVVLCIINLLILFNRIIEVSSALNCKISVPDAITSQKLDNIRCIGTNGYTFPNFATFSDGSLIIETSKDSGTIARKFYGITSDGRPYFENNQYQLTIFSGSGCYRKESENVVITFNDDEHSEYLTSFGNYVKNTDKNIEFYDFKTSSMKYKIDTNVFIGNKEMDSDVQTLINYYDGNNYYLYHAYLTKDCYFFIRKIKFTSADPVTYTVEKSYSMKYIYGKIASCYMSKDNNIVCITIYSISILTSPHLYISLFNSDLERKLHTSLDYTMVPNGVSYPYFFKCIHLKDEIGVFVFYRSGLTRMINTPMILFKKYYNNKIIDFISYIELNKKQFNTDRLLNDIIKINEKKICFISTNDIKEEMYIVLISILDNTNLAIRYYTFDIFSSYTFKFYLHMRANIYHNFIAFSFSFCRIESCKANSDTHYPGLIIFNYPNGTDFRIDHITNIFTNNELIDNYTINLHNQVRIENNIFGLEYSHINIKKYINCNSIQFVSSVFDTVNVIETYNLTEEENIIAKEIPLEKTECTISYTYVITEPDYEEYNSYPTEKIFTTTYTEAKFEDEKDIYEGRLLYYNISVSEDLSDNCQDLNCLICKNIDKTKCIICKFNYIINRDEDGKYKSCVPEGIIVTIPNEIDENEPSTQIYEDDNDDEDDYDEEDNNNEDNKEIDNNEDVNNGDIPDETYEFNKTEVSQINLIKNIDSYSTNILIPQIIDSNGCSYEEIIFNQCKNIKLNNDQIEDIYDIMKDIFLSDFDGQTKVVSTENVVYQITTTEFQKNNDDPEVSSIDLGTCEDKLKESYNISDDDSLIIFKIDLNNDDNSQKYIYYEIYDPYEHQQLNLSLCDDFRITINTPVNLDENSIMLYENLKQYGYNIFDSGDNFYNDICSTYTTVNGTDMLLEDRKKDIFSTSGNHTMCQEGCEFISYNTTTKKSKCDCNVQANLNTSNLVNVEFSTKELASEFYKTINNSNFRVLKCYKLSFDIKNPFENIGRIIMTSFFFIYLISLFCYIIKERKKIDMFINLILKSKENSKKINFRANEEKIKIKEKIPKKAVEQKSNSKQTKKSNLKSRSQTKKEKHFPPRKKIINQNKKKNDFSNSSTRNMNTINVMKKNSEEKKININIHPIKTIKLGKDINNKNYHIKEEKAEFKKDNKKKKDYPNLSNFENLNDEELNSLEYNDAILIDKRTYFQYYWSLLKKDHLILFTILPANDYNLYSLKVALFILSFSLYFTINGFFFTDSTMHKVNQNNGKYEIVSQIPQILYSSIITTIINILLKMLSLSEKNILLLKQEKDLKKTKENSSVIKRCIIIKFIFFFIISNILLLFFWYFISCFCAVYTNTQTVLIKDTLISFSLSMLYPFGLNLLPGLFRIPALRDKTQRSKCLYQIGGILASI